MGMMLGESPLLALSVLLKYMENRHSQRGCAPKAFIIFFFFLFFCPINLEYPLLSKVSLCSVWTHYVQSWKWCLSFGEHSSLELFLLEHLEKISNMTS